MWGALSDEKTVLQFTIAAGPSQGSRFRVWIPRSSWPFYTFPATVVQTVQKTLSICWFADKTENTILCSWRESSSGMWRHTALVGTDVSEKLITSTLRMRKISELWTMLVVTSNCSTLQRITLHSSQRVTAANNSVALSPLANYTDWSTATCRRNLVPTFADRGASRGQRGGSPTVVNLTILSQLQITSYIASSSLMSSSDASVPTRATRRHIP
jgi:hypothetical protein